MLIDALKEIQKEKKLTNQRMADKLGIHKISWLRIKSRRAEFGKKFLMGVRQAYPELRGVIDTFLAGDKPKSNWLRRLFFGE